MYNNEYEDYMRSVLGYPIQNQQTTYNNIYENNNSYFPYRSSNNVDSNKYESLYPEIYRTLKPMIKNACNNLGFREISNDTLEIMANEIYTNVESNINVVNVNVNTKEADTRKDMKITKVPDDEKRACCGNPTLKDLIKIMLLNQLINNNQNRPPRPPHSPMPRPPYREFENPSIYNNQSFPYYN